MRAIAVGRKNYLFLGSDVGGQTAAVWYSLVQSCKRLEIEPWRYLRDVLERLPFVTGYGVDIALLIDAHATLGLDAIAQVDLDVRQNAHQSLRDLGPMAYAVLQAVTSRLVREGRLDAALPTSFTAPGDDGPDTISSEPVQRPPLRSLRAAA